jgi:uncharacterized cupin superfamily protein
MPEPRAIAVDLISEKSGTGYPEPFRGAVAGRRWQALGDAFGLTDFGVNLCILPPGTASSQRHWHTEEDELVYMLDGELTLVTNAGRQSLLPGMVVGFAKGRADGHHLLNESGAPARFLVVGSRHHGDECHYPDIDLMVTADGTFRHRSGEPW